NRVILQMSIQRIQDIANNLLKDSQNNGPKKSSSTMLSPVIEEILSEKRTQYKSLSHISINGPVQVESSIFAIINASELKQVLSNFINNSVEAIDKDAGIIQLSLYQENDKAVIE